MTKSTKKKEVVLEPLNQRIDFTQWLQKNPRMRPKTKKHVDRKRKAS